jgi:hypothetical protein
VKKKLLLLLALLAVGAAVAVMQVRRSRPDLGPAPSADEIARLQARRDELSATLATRVRLREKSLDQAPKGGIMLGIPTRLTESVVQQVVTGMFDGMTLTLRNLKVHKEGEVKAKMLVKKRTIGKYVLDVAIQEVEGVLKPGPPQLTFSENRIGIRLPVRLAEGGGHATLRLQWDSKGMAANSVCGDVDTTRGITGGVVPTDYQVEGAFLIATRGESVTLTPSFPDLAVRIFVDPSEQAWGVVDDVIRERSAGCEIALEKVDIKALLGRIVDKGFNVKIPQKILKPMRLPAGVKSSLKIQGMKLPLSVKFTGVLIAPERIWYGADLTLGRPEEPPKP